MKISAESAEDTKGDDRSHVSCIITQFITHQETQQKGDSMLKTGNNIVNDGIISAMPRSILRIRSEIETRVFEPHVPTNGKPS